MKNIIKLTKFNLYIHRKNIIGWTIAITAIMILYMSLFPSIKDIAQAELDAMPKEILQFMGMDKTTKLADYTSYYAMVYGIILIPISIFAATFSANQITKEEKTKVIEFLNGLAVSRKEIYISKYITSLIAISIVVVIANLAPIICGNINGGETFIADKIIESVKVTSFIPIFYGGIALALASFSSKTGSGAVASSVVVFTYMMGYLGELLVDKAAFLKDISPFIIFSVNNALNITDNVIFKLLVYIVIYIICLICGKIIYQKRDFKI